jgi:hypothetical protein
MKNFDFPVVSVYLNIKIPPLGYTFYELVYKKIKKLYIKQVPNGSIQ